ncbi:MAG: heme-copper oxidase subunit III [Candidatus Melainabacteria bacterium]|nr:MAG: heme-copper oxidase subunit III [Candidatus Melainabacteria bacterium]
MKDRVTVGMLLFVASEAVFFLMLVLAYVNFHKQTGETAASVLDPIKTGVFTVALLSSSFTMWLAEKAREKESNSVAMWLGATIILGGIFIVGQGLEYAHLVMDKITISRDLFGSTFFTLTGFHGLHVLIGLVLLLLLLGLSVFGRKHEPTNIGMQSIAIYWHFVDAVWIVVFSTVYLWRYV